MIKKKRIYADIIVDQRKTRNQEVLNKQKRMN